ncbi:hypothetical protein KIM372_10730 [Bombiscardovia nodaiensis]|uniref:Uncharacterized protein n=1 Tax=Bombiscardovia nodaiensis TaxID=2932181 RepID=A0ABN6SEE5_9BIFI|nr:hypothetical protein KIM372_10730 [Bombiscardovia nodaiensis]
MDAEHMPLVKDFARSFQSAQGLGPAGAIDRENADRSKPPLFEASFQALPSEIFIFGHKVNHPRAGQGQQSVVDDG